MSDAKVYTYWPKNGAVFSGKGAEEFDLTKSYHSESKIGHLSFDGSSKKYKIHYGMQTKKALVAIKNGGYNASLGEQSIDHINAFTLLRELVGTPDEQYFLENIARTVNVPSLDARIPERDAFKAHINVKPLEELDFTQVKYGEDHFKLTYNATPFFHPSEDRMRGVIDPTNVDLQESQRALKEARNALALWGLIGLTDGAGDLGDWESTNAGGVNDVDPKKVIMKAIQDHWKSTQSRINWVAMNPVDYQRYLGNDNVKGFQPGLPVQNAGIVPMFGIPNLTAALDPMVPMGTAYFVDNQAFLKGVGPIQTEQWRRPENNADLGVVRDYVQFLLMNPTRYGFKNTIDLTTSGDTADTEPTTLEEVRALIGNPQVAVNPPTIG